MVVLSRFYFLESGSDLQESPYHSDFKENDEGKFKGDQNRLNFFLKE